MVRISKPARTLIITMGVLVIIAIVISRKYYRDQEASVDPRIKPARELYEEYNNFAALNQFDSVFQLMDTIESIYTSTNHYASSFELGVIYNNRAAAWLTLGIFGEYYDDWERDSLVARAETAVRKSMRIYENWKENFGDLDELQIKQTIIGDFTSGLEGYSTEVREKFLESRIDEITEAQAELDRRMSVSFTNLGIVYRHREVYDSAAICYQKALELWDRNLTAENNLNSLLGRPQKKRNFIERLFPPERL
ncbi:MAG: tetratricopeptide repeat protein [Bacteroidales bacterium]